LLSGIFFLLTDFRPSWLCKLKEALTRFFVKAQALEDGCAHFDLAALAFMGPFRKFDFGHQFRFHPVRAARSLNLSAKRVLFYSELFQLLPHRRMRGMGEAAARLAYVDQLSIFVIKPQDERSKMFARAARVGIAGNHAFLPAGDLDLQPFP